MRESTKRWLKAAVITFGVVDCVGIYVAQHRLTQPVLADPGTDLAYALPAETGVFRPDQGMPSLDRPAMPAHRAKAAPAAARLAVAAPAATPSAPHFAAPHLAVVAPAVTPLHRDGAAALPGTVKLARIDAARPAAATAAGAKRAAAVPAPAPLAALVPHRSHDRLFAEAFSGMANVPLDAPITVQLDDAPARSALADDGSASDLQLAHNSGTPTTARDSSAAAGSAAALPEAGPAAILPDSDVL